MARTILNTLKTIELEERILHSGIAVGLVGMFLPWFSRDMGDRVVYFSGFEFFTVFMGITAFLLYVYSVLLFSIPLVGGPPLIRRQYKYSVRFFCIALATLLTLFSLSVLTVATFEFSRADVRFGVYLSLIGGVVATLYAAIQWREESKRSAQNFFHHPEDENVVDTPKEEPKEIAKKSTIHHPPPPPPPPLEPEDHKPFR